MKKAQALFILVFSANVYGGKKTAALIELHNKKITTQNGQKDTLEQINKKNTKNPISDSKKSIKKIKTKDNEKKVDNDRTFTSEILEPLLDSALINNDNSTYNSLLNIYAFANTTPKW